jgi:uncharacterized protein (DUF934 family)
MIQSDDSTRNKLISTKGGNVKQRNSPSAQRPWQFLNTTSALENQVSIYLSMATWLEHGSESLTHTTAGYRSWHRAPAKIVAFSFRPALSRQKIVL